MTRSGSPAVGRRGRRALLGALAAVLAGSCSGPRPSPPPGLVGVAVRGHQEVALGEGAEPVPRFFAPRPKLGLCAATTPETDTSQWRATLSLRPGRRGTAGLRAEAVRMETTVCFEASPEVAGPWRGELCGEIEDTFDRRTYRLGCRPVAIEPEPSGFRALLAALAEALRGTASAPAAKSGGPAAPFDRLTEQAAAEGFPLLAQSLKLIAAYHLRRDGSAPALAEARARLAEAPAWLSFPEASEWAAQLAQERALLELAVGWRPRRAWELLREADEAYLRIADPKRFTVAMQQADLLARVGAVAEAADRLRAALADCGRAPCDERLLPAARGTLAWLVLQDPLADEADLAAAEAVVGQALAATDSSLGPLEHANLRINLAFLRLRGGANPAPELAAARALIASAPDGARRRQLRDWGSWVEARAELRAGRTGTALAACLELARSAEEPRLAAWALTCAGQARRRLGDLDRAAEMFERALALDEAGASSELGQNIALGSGQRAEAFYEAARVAVERGRPAAGWDLLARLDRLLLGEEELRHCREASGAASGEASGALRAEIDQESRRLLARLAALEAPASGARRGQRGPVRRALLARLQELEREAGGCAPPAATSRDRAVDLRAVALEDEILVLRQEPDGRVALFRRAALPRAELVPLLRRVRRGLDRRDLDDQTWRALLTPLAAVLLPPVEAPEPVRYALHGVLQEAPLGALPWPGGGGASSPRWLGEARAIALRPAGIAGPASEPAPSAARLFVVDPAGNLASAGALAALYRRLFPGGTVLAGQAATRSAVREALPRAGWVHFDTHGAFDAAFPELTRLALADGFLDLGELASWQGRPEVANLVGCDTGRWPPTADSGRYGVGGLFCRRGARWVVATRAAVADPVAAGFNRSFYGAVADGRSVPQAFASALAELARAHPAVDWAPFVLLDGERSEEGKGPF